MTSFSFSDLFKNLGGEFSKVLKGAFEKPMKTFASDMQKNYKVLVQNLSGKKADYKDLVKIYNDYISGDEKALEQTPYQKEFVFC